MFMFILCAFALYLLVAYLQYQPATIHFYEVCIANLIIFFILCATALYFLWVNLRYEPPPPPQSTNSGWDQGDDGWGQGDDGWGQGNDGWGQGNPGWGTPQAHNPVWGGPPHSVAQTVLHWGPTEEEQAAIWEALEPELALEILQAPHSSRYRLVVVHDTGMGDPGMDDPTDEPTVDDE